MNLHTCIHPDAVLDGRITLKDSPLAALPRIEGVYDWRIGHPRVWVDARGVHHHQAGGSYIGAPPDPSPPVLAELRRQGIVPNAAVMINAENPYPCWEQTPEPTRAAARANTSADDPHRAALYEARGLHWWSSVVHTLRTAGHAVGAYEPAPDWCEATPGLCYEVCRHLDFAVVPFYVHRGYSGDHLYPTAWYALQWRRRVERYRRACPWLRLIPALCPVVSWAGSRVYREALSEPYLRAQIETARVLGLSHCVIWDAPLSQSELALTEDALGVWRKRGGA